MKNIVLIICLSLISGCLNYPHETNPAGIISYAQEMQPPKPILYQDDLWYMGERNGYHYFMCEYGPMLAPPYLKDVNKRLFKVRFNSQKDFQSLNLSKKDIFPFADDRKKWKKIKSIELKRAF